MAPGLRLNVERAFFPVEVGVLGVLRGEVKEESEAVVVRTQSLLTFPLLIFALEKLKLGKPLVNCVFDFRPIGVILLLNDRNVCVENFEVCLFALGGDDRLIRIIADVLPRSGAVSERRKYGPVRSAGAAPTSEIDLVLAPVFAFADLAIECDCHLASNG